MNRILLEMTKQLEITLNPFPRGFHLITNIIERKLEGLLDKGLLNIFIKHTLERSDDMPAHVQSSIVGSSLNIPIQDGNLNLGTLQGIYLYEFRNRGGATTLTLTI